MQYLVASSTTRTRNRPWSNRKRTIRTTKRASASSWAIESLWLKRNERSKSSMPRNQGNSVALWARSINIRSAPNYIGSSRRAEAIAEVNRRILMLTFCSRWSAFNCRIRINFIIMPTCSSSFQTDQLLGSNCSSSTPNFRNKPFLNNSIKGLRASGNDRNQCSRSKACCSLPKTS